MKPECETIWLQPWCNDCANQEGVGRLWCQDDAWGVCDQGCGRKSVKYVIADDTSTEHGRLKPSLSTNL